MRRATPIADGLTSNLSTACHGNDVLTRGEAYPRFIGSPQVVAAARCTDADR